MDGGARGGRGRGRGRGRAFGPEGGRGRGRARGVQEPQANFGVPEHLLNFAVPEHLINQNPEVDELNEELSSKYVDIQNLRDSIARLRAVVPNDQISHEKRIEVCLDEYRHMCSRGADLRNRIRRMDPPGIPFDEPEGFDVLP